MTEPTLPEKVVALDRALGEAGIAHAFGGAIALAYYAEPRSTIDVDCNVFVTVDEQTRVSAALSALELDATIDGRRLASDGQTRIWWGRTPVDLFFAYDAFHDAMAGALRRVEFGSTTIPILGPEHLVVCKATFDRAKDWLDIEQVLVCVEGFDVKEARRWLRALLGSDDQRCERFDRLAAELLGR